MESWSFIVLALATLNFVSAVPDCSALSNGSRVLNLTISHRRNKTGHWETLASGYKDSDGVRKGMELEMNQGLLECGGGKYISFIEAALREGPSGKGDQKYFFHPRTGRNAALSNNRKTAFRKTDNENQGVVLTESTLVPNVLFEVVLEKVTTKHPYNLGIGITTHPPNDFAIPDHMNAIKTGTWMYYDKRVFRDGAVLLSSYGKNIDDNAEFQVGNQIGMVLTNDGDLYIYINGVNQGPAISKVPKNVYGVVELRGKAMQVSINDDVSSMELPKKK